MKIKVTFETTINTEASAEEIQRWLEFELGANGSLSMDNPLEVFDLEADSFSVNYTTK